MASGGPHGRAGDRRPRRPLNPVDIGLEGNTIDVDPPAAPRRTVACALVLGAAWGVWFHRLGVIDLDDAASNEVLFARQPLSNVLFDLPWSDQSPLSFLILHFWRAWGEDAAAIRVLNLLLLTASLLLFYAVARRLCPPPRVALGALVLAALSPASLWVVRNGRMYTLQLLLWMVSLVFLLRYSERRHVRDLAGFAMVSVLGIYNHFIGFVSTATALLWLMAEAVAESRRSPTKQEAPARPLLGPPVAAGLAILVLVQPQVMRFLGLLQAPPAVIPGQALPGGLLPFLDAVSWFWFMSAGWGPLEARAPVMRAVYLAGAYALFVMGLARGSARMRRLVVLTALLPLVLIGVAGGHMDFRDRHLLYLLPLVWLAVANGALGGEGAGLRVRPAVARGAMTVLVVVGAASAWLLYNKLPERYIEWTKLMDGVAQLDGPDMALYMAPGPLTGTPTLLASQLDPTGGLAIRPLSSETRQEFMAEASEQRAFAFLADQWSRADAEHDWRVRYLAGQGYRRVVLPAAGATAQVFTRGEIPRFSVVTKLPAGPSSRDVVAWARSRAKDPSRPPRAATALGRAFVARVQADGTARESTFFMSQRGENGYWRLGAADGDAVEEARVRVEDAETDVLIARPAGDSLLVIVFPALDLADSLRLTCGGASPRGGTTGVVSAELFINGDEAALATCPLGRWSDTLVDTARARAGPSDVTVALTAVGVDATEIAFRLRPFGDAVAPPPEATPRPSGPYTLTAARTLKDQLPRLRVSRMSVSGFGRVGARFETVPRSAAEMHESTARLGEGGLDARWELGDLPWDAVGVTRQRMAGEVKSGLWAHPKKGTTLVIEANGLARGRVLDGFYGLTDFAVERASAAGLAEPIGFRVFLDGRPLLTRQVSRARGGHPFSVELPEPLSGAGRLRIEIDAVRDEWAHFVFDLWAR